MIKFSDLTVFLLQQAVNFLNSMNWNTEGRACFACLMLIMNYLLKLPLNSEREGVNKMSFLLLILTLPTMFGTEISNLFVFL